MFSRPCAERLLAFSTSDMAVPSQMLLYRPVVGQALQFLTHYLICRAPCCAADGAHCDSRRQAQDKGCVSSPSKLRLLCGCPCAALPGFRAVAKQDKAPSGLIRSLLPCIHDLHLAILTTLPPIPPPFNVLLLFACSPPRSTCNPLTCKQAAHFAAAA